MARKRLNFARLGPWAVAALLLTGCAGSRPPTPTPAPAPESPQERAGEPRERGDDPPPVTEPQPDPQAREQPRAPSPSLALLQQSERSAEHGDLDSAIAYVERAIRLEPRNASLWLRLGRLKLTAERPAAAEQMAQKALALAADDDAERRAWLLMADVREAQGDTEAAARIRARWRTYRG